jgi:hypothetical protein
MIGFNMLNSGGKSWAFDADVSTLTPGDDATYRGYDNVGPGFGSAVDGIMAGVTIDEFKANKSTNDLILETTADVNGTNDFMLKCGDGGYAWMTRTGAGSYTGNSASINFNINLAIVLVENITVEAAV